MKVLLISDNNELFNALRRALKYVASIDLIKDSGRFNKRNVVIYAMENSEIDYWMWNNFRNKSLSPLVVIGTEETSFFINRNPVFAAYSDEHAYFQIPYVLINLVDKVRSMKPIYDNVTRKLIFNDFSKGYEYKLVTHNLKIIKSDKAASIDNLEQVRRFYCSKGDSKTARIIDNKIKQIRRQDDWVQIALELRQYLEDKLKGKI